MTRIVQERRARSTGTVVQVADNRDGSVDQGDLDWFTICVDHGGVCSHPSLQLAREWASEPEGWCPTCQADTAEAESA